jgi:hypothetical protein
MPVADLHYITPECRLIVVATSVADAKVEWHHVSASVVLHVRDRYPNTVFKYIQFHPVGPKTSSHPTQPRPH